MFVETVNYCQSYDRQHKILDLTVSKMKKVNSKVSRKMPIIFKSLTNWWCNVTEWQILFQGNKRTQWPTQKNECHIYNLLA